MQKPQLLLLIMLVLALLGAAACSGPPETQVYIVVTSTHQPPTLTALAEGGNPVTPPPGAPTETPPEAAEATAEVTIEGFPTPLPTANPMPTAVVSQIQVAEQVFEHGRMFWLQPVREIWVMVNAPDATDHGDWWIFEDTFEEGEPEIDPEVTPPADLIQPRRGFGKLWRENEEVRDALGWGVTPEFGFVTRYEYRPGGYLDANGEYVPGPGVHVLVSLGNETFAFDEATMTWRLVE